MNYLFAKKYNPSYDTFILRCFRANGIQIDEDTTFESAESITEGFKRKYVANAKGSTDYYYVLRKKMTQYENLFWDYVIAWRRHIQVRPSLYHWLEAALGKPYLGLRTLRELESELPHGDGKLLFTGEEIAQDISDFYRRRVRHPLKRDIDGGRVRELWKYLLPQEIEKLPSSRRVGFEAAEGAILKTANELLQWLSGITPHNVLVDINGIITRHFDDPEHMKLEKKDPHGQERIWNCEHSSELLTLLVHREVDDRRLEMIVMPLRGSQLVEEGWYEISFPFYYPREVENNTKED